MDADTAGADPRHPTDDVDVDVNDVTEPMNADRNDERPPWNPPAPPPRSRPSWLDVPIARDREGRRIAGVVGGICNVYGFDRRTTRLAVALGTLLVPGIIALYVAGVIFLPRADEPPRSLRAIAADRRRRPLMIVLGVLAIAVATGFGSWAFWRGLGWGFALVAIGIVLWLAPNLGRRAAPPATARVAGDQPWGAPGMPAPAAMAPTVPAPSVPAPTAAAPRRRRYPVQAIGLGLAAVGALVTGLGNSAGWWHASTYSIVVAVVITLIAATVVGAVVNRSWFGIPMLLVLTAAAVTLGVTHPDLDGGFGQRTYRPTTVAEAQVAQHLGIGQLTVDLTRVPLGSQPLQVVASVGYGRVRILVPAEAALQIRTDVNAGHVVVDGEETSAGLRRDDTLTVPARSGDGAGPTIELDIGVGAGEVSVSHA